MRELSLHVLDALQNSLEAGATFVNVVIGEDLPGDRLTITIRDNGRGMDAGQLTSVFNPFYTTRTTRHVGLGVPLFQAAAQRCSGDLTMTSEVGKGTTLEAAFQHSHIDRAPLGDMTGTLMAVILSGKCDLHYAYRLNDREFEFDTGQFKAELGEIPLTHPAVRDWLREFIAEGEAALTAMSGTGR